MPTRNKTNLIWTDPTFQGMSDPRDNDFSDDLVSSTTETYRSKKCIDFGFWVLGTKVIKIWLRP